ncbi:26600_t:CDS:2 [Dentiscutata erythropus]|uniref:26600_t:CDS:1 n=1 Tax=Dentiscutata erythropus TaxID=1348616 RepID=A0A9N9IHU4_9GLOM|nr:26600_t:CDS:2 [Dentiscutata erythropus]
MADEQPTISTKFTAFPSILAPGKIIFVELKKKPKSNDMFSKYQNHKYADIYLFAAIPFNISCQFNLSSFDGNGIASFSLLITINETLSNIQMNIFDSEYDPWSNNFNSEATPFVKSLTSTNRYYLVNGLVYILEIVISEKE